MNKLAVLCLLFGAALSAKIPLRKRNLSMSSLLEYQERLRTVGMTKYGASNGQEVPITDYENTQYFATVSLGTPA
jgi:hypothetical protein